MTRSIEDVVQEWHERAEDGIPLHVFLGMTWDEYAMWFETGQLPVWWGGS